MRAHTHTYKYTCVYICVCLYTCFSFIWRISDQMIYTYNVWYQEAKGELILFTVFFFFSSFKKKNKKTWKDYMMIYEKSWNEMRSYEKFLNFRQDGKKITLQIRPAIKVNSRGLLFSLSDIYQCLILHRALPYLYHYYHY